MVNTRRCFDCGKKFEMKAHTDERCPRCAREDAAAGPSNIDPNAASQGERAGELDYYNFTHHGKGTPLFHRRRP